MDDLQQMVERINVLKKKLGFTTKNVSELSGVPTGTLNKIMCMETKDPTVTSVIKIAHALGVTADFLIYGKEPVNSSIQIDLHEQGLLENFRELNEEGQEKVFEYTSDMVALGRHKKHHQSGLDSQKQA